MEVYQFWRSHHVNAGEQITLADAVTRFLAFRESRVRPDSYTAEKSCLNKFAEFVGNESAVNEVTSQTVVRFLDSIRDRKGVNASSNKTWNNTRGALLTFFGWTTKKPQQFTAHNIVADIEPKAKEDKDIQIVTAAQVSSLMGHVSTLKDDRYARFFALAAFAGIRPDGELGKLEERDIDLENGVIKIRKEVSKVRKSRQITIEPNLRSWLVKFRRSAAERHSRP